MRKPKLGIVESMVNKGVAVFHILLDVLRNMGRALGKPLAGKPPDESLQEEITSPKSQSGLKKEEHLRRIENIRRYAFIGFVVVSVFVVSFSEITVTSTQDQQTTVSPVEPKISTNNSTCKTASGCNTPSNPGKCSTDDSRRYW